MAAAAARRWIKFFGGTVRSTGFAICRYTVMSSAHGGFLATLQLSYPPRSTPSNHSGRLRCLRIPTIPLPCRLRQLPLRSHPPTINQRSPIPRTLPPPHHKTTPYRPILQIPRNNRALLPILLIRRTLRQRLQWRRNDRFRKHEFVPRTTVHEIRHAGG